MNLSARNQLKATVAAVKKGAVNDEVSLRLADGTTLTSIITIAIQIALLCVWWVLGLPLGPGVTQFVK